MILWRVADTKDACLPLSKKSLLLSGQVREAAWLAIPSSRPVDVFSFAAPTTDDASYPFLLLTYVAPGRGAELFDFSRPQVLRRFDLASAAALVRSFTCSDDHTRVALATSDGAVLIYPLQGEGMGSLGDPEASEPTAGSHDEPAQRETLPVETVSPVFSIKVFDCPPPSSLQAFWGIAFYEGSSALLTLGNGVELKYWELPDLDSYAKTDLTGSINSNQDNDNTEQSCQIISKPHGQILLPRPARCWSTTSIRGIEKGMDTSNTTPSEEDIKGSIAIGDEKGHVMVLSIWKP
ncbi:unnamed protein product [Phytomonas sp. Hart1]|nr:unnamed protein product [Phytomonas sp. Hart1]|eukprot:CCW69444.1 unnamed protein product [Phytomonas sp. isolate Hart1]